MYGFLIALLILDGIFLSIVVLLQSGKGGGLAAMGGGAAATDGIMGGRQATTLLTRATWTSGSVFMVLSLVLSIMSSQAQQATSVIRPDMPSAPTPVLPGVGGGADAGTDAGTPAPVGDATGGAEDAGEGN